MSAQSSEVREPWMLAIHRWVQGASSIPQSRIRWADSEAPWPSTADGPWISLRDLGDSPNGREFVEVAPRAWSFSPAAVEGVNADANQLQISLHSFRDGDGPVRVTGSALPGGLAASIDYWAIRDGASLLRLAASFEDAIARAAIDLNSTGALPIAVTSTSATRRAGAEADVLTSAPFNMELGVQCRGAEAMAVLRRMRSAAYSEALCAPLLEANVGLLDIGAIQNLGAALNSASYEPRASMTVRLSVAPKPHIETIATIRTVVAEREE